MNSVAQADTQARLGFAQNLLDETDEIALAGFRGQLDVRTKVDGTLVTQTDVQIERMIRERLADLYPADGLLGEELGQTDERSEGRWIIDPIDATHNFVRRIGVFATLLAFQRDGQMELGIVSAPALGQRWFATRAGGAFLRESSGARPIHVSDIALLKDAHVLFGSIAGNSGDGDGDPGLTRLARGAWRDRGFGDFWGHVLVASGSAEVMVDTGLKPWDLAAPAMIVTEAGGRVTDFAGVATWTGPQAVSTNGVLHEIVLARLR